MSKSELQRSKAKLQDSLGRMSGAMNELGQHMEKTEKTVRLAADAGHSFLGEIDKAAADFIADLNTSNGPEDAVNQPELAVGRDEAAEVNPTDAATS